MESLSVITLSSCLTDWAWSHWSESGPCSILGQGAEIFLKSLCYPYLLPQDGRNLLDPVDLTTPSLEFPLPVKAQPGPYHSVIVGSYFLAYKLFRMWSFFP